MTHFQQYYRNIDPITAKKKKKKKKNDVEGGEDA